MSGIVFDTDYNGRHNHKQSDDNVGITNISSYINYGPSGRTLVTTTSGKCFTWYIQWQLQQL
jgi:hypothetical protein